MTAYNPPIIEEFTGTERRWKVSPHYKVSHGMRRIWRGNFFEYLFSVLAYPSVIV